MFKFLNSPKNQVNIAKPIIGIALSSAFKDISALSSSDTNREDSLSDSIYDDTPGFKCSNFSKIIKPTPFQTFPPTSSTSTSVSDNQSSTNTTPFDLTSFKMDFSPSHSPNQSLNIDSRINLNENEGLSANSPSKSILKKGIRSRYSNKNHLGVEL